MSETETTQGQWKAVMKTTLKEQWGKLSEDQRTDTVKMGLDNAHKPNLPMVFVNWGESFEYCKKITQLHNDKKNIPSLWEYRLPTEAQWEYSCRAGTKDIFSFGSSGLTFASYGNFRDRSSGLPRADNSQNDGYKFTAPVGKFNPNPWGFLDMHGNVYEWCKEVLGVYPKNAVDPDGRHKYLGHGYSSLVIRGGAWASDVWNCASAVRQGSYPQERTSAIGFRPCIVQIGSYRKSETHEASPTERVEATQGKLFSLHFYTWARGDDRVKMMPKTRSISVFSSIGGKFAGGGESVELSPGTDDFWYLKGKSMQFLALQATAIEPIGANPFGIPRRVDLPANGKTVRLIQSKDGFAFLSAVVGNYLDGRCSVRVRLDKDGWWYLEGSGPKTRFGSATVVPWAEGVAPPLVESYRWQKGDKPIKMLRPDEGFCFLSKINGGFRGGGVEARGIEPLS